MYPTASADIPNIGGTFKAGVTRSIKNPKPLWQKSYHDHIIRSEKDYLQIWQYIEGNVGKWLEDCFYCQ